MSKGRWWTQDRESFIKSMSEPFRSTPAPSKRQEASSRREYNPESFIKRVTPQIHEMIDRGLTFNTPEEWDKGFEILGGGQSRRKSERVLARMKWDQFLAYAEGVIALHKINSSSED